MSAGFTETILFILTWLRSWTVNIWMFPWRLFEQQEVNISLPASWWITYVVNIWHMTSWLAVIGGAGWLLVALLSRPGGQSQSSVTSHFSCSLFALTQLLITWFEASFRLCQSAGGWVKSVGERRVSRCRSPLCDCLVMASCLISRQLSLCVQKNLWLSSAGKPKTTTHHPLFGSNVFFGFFFNKDKIHKRLKTPLFYIKIGFYKTKCIDLYTSTK